MFPNRRTFHLFPVIAIVVAVAYYGQFLHNFFAFDDFKYLENMFRGWGDVAIGYGSLRLVSNFSWWPLFELSGFDPFAYNLFALILFTANGILLYFLLIRLLPDRTTAFLAATFFMTGSAGADAVLWKATNSSVISLFFYLSALICYVDFRLLGERKRYYAAIGLFIAAMFSKEEAASLPMTAALIDIMFLGGGKELQRLLRRLIPFCAIIAFYLVANGFVFNFLLGGQAEPEKLFFFRPLYSLLGGGAAFFLGPDGFLRPSSPPVYLTALFLFLCSFLKRSRRLLIFGCLWIFLAFLPQSLTRLGQLEPRVIVNSISRYLYITSIGSSIVFAAVLAGLREWVPRKVWYGVAGSMLILFVAVHYPQVEVRGEEWQTYGTDVEDFIAETKRVMPAFPAPSFVHVVNRPTGRAFMQQALRAFYGNPLIEHVDDPVTAKNQDKKPLYVILYVPGSVQPVEVLHLN